MKLLAIIIGNLSVLGFGILLRYLYRKYIRNESDVTFCKLYKGKHPKSEEYSLEDFENEMSNRGFGCLFIIIIAFLLSFLLN